MFTNAQQSIPKCFRDKMAADQAWKEYKADKVIFVGDKMIEAQRKRADVLRSRAQCQKFIKDAMNPTNSGG